MALRTQRTGLTLLLLGASTLIAADLELKPETLKGWNDYIQTVEARLHAPNEDAFISHKSAALRDGRIFVEASPDNFKQVPGGLIHDWTGVAFFPDCRTSNILAVVNDYEHYKQIYKPGVLDARKTGASGDEDLYQMILKSRSVLTSNALQGDYKAAGVQVNPTRFYRISQMTKAWEIENYQRNNERKLPPDVGHGYVWRAYTVAKFEEADGGVYLEYETIILSRELPSGMRWMVCPAIKRFARNSMTTSLEETRRAVTKAPLATEASGAAPQRSRHLSKSFN